jgi:hypothetical protein
MRGPDVSASSWLSFLLGLLLVVGACTRHTLREARFVPTSWHPEAGQRSERGQPAATQCPLTMTDSRGTQFVLRRSEERGEWAPGDSTVRRYTSTGYYSVSPEARLGVRAGHWLRVECGTLTATAIVRAGA